MNTRPLPALCTAIVTSVMAFGVTTATARNFSISNQNFRVTFNNFEVEAIGNEDSCRVTLEGSLHARTIAKVAGSLVGYITRATIGQCRVGTTVLATTLPWHISYESFNGRLPDITAIDFRVTGVSVRQLNCLYRADLRFESTHIIRILPILWKWLRQIIPFIEGFLCPSEGTLQLAEEGQIYQSGSTTRLTLTLI